MKATATLAFISILCVFLSASFPSRSAAASQWSPETRLTFINGPGHDPEPAVNGDSIYVVWSENILLDATSEIMLQRTVNRGITWEPPQRLTYDTWTNEQPEMVFSQGTVHIVYTDYRDGNYPDGGEIYYLRSPNGGVYFEEPRQLSFGIRFSTTPRIAVGPNGALYVVYWDWRNFQTSIYFTRSTDNGQSWSQEKILTEIDYLVDSSHPAIAVDATGVLHVAWIDTRYGWPLGGYSPAAALYIRSWDDGDNWSFPPARLTSAPMSTFEDNYSVSLKCDSQNHLHFTYWADRGGSNVFYRRSEDSGDTWTQPMQLSAFDGSHPSLEYVETSYPDIYFGSSSEVDVTYFSHYNTCLENTRLAGDIFLRQSLDGGATWGDQQQMSHSGRALVPKMTGTDKWKFLIWEDERDYYNPGQPPFGSELYYRLFDEPNLPDHILVLLGGYGTTAISGAAGGTVNLAVYAVNPSGNSRVRRVELMYHGIPLGLQLMDDGNHGDFAAGDNIYGLLLEIPPGTPPDDYPLEVKVTDSRNETTVWPYLTIHNGEDAPDFSGAPFGPVISPNFGRQIGSERYEADTLMLYGGYWYTYLDEQAAGTLTIMAVITDDRGIGWVNRVELYYQGLPTGVLLDDSGPGGGVGDWAPDDGIFTLTTQIPSGALDDAAGQYELQIVATNAMNQTVVWPELRIFE